MREATAEVHWGTSGWMNTRGRMVGGWTNERLDSTRVESSQPRHPGAYRRLWAAPYPTATHVRERKRQRRGKEKERERETKYTRKTEWFEETREGEGKEDLRNPLSPSENPRREARCRRCVDKPRSILLLTRASLFFSMFFQETVKLTSLFLPRERFLSLFLLLR